MKIPGTTIEADIKDSKLTVKAIFSAGGLVLSQVAELTGAAPYDIQNWIRRGFCPPPVNKRYDMKKFCRIATICMLRKTLSIPETAGLLSYINGKLDREDDDAIDDDDLYFCILKAIECIDGIYPDRQHVIIATDTASTEFLSTHEDVSERLHRVIETVVYAYISSQFKEIAHERLLLIGITPSEK